MITEIEKIVKHIIANQVFVQHFGRIASDRQRLDSIRQTTLGLLAVSLDIFIFS